MDPNSAIPPSATRSCEVFIAGGGPGGSTLAALLARRGRDVVMVEKEHHPRFHIGESLLPANVALFDELGVREQVERMGMPKWGIEFVSTEHEHRSYVEFADAWDKSAPYAWQVRRSELDEMLFRHAGGQGARTLEGHRVRDVIFDAEGATVEVELPDGSRQTWRTRFFVDATGRDTLLANKFRCKTRTPGTTARPCSGTSAMRAASKASAKATSASPGSRTAGSGSSRWPTAPRAWERCAGRTT